MSEIDRRIAEALARIAAFVNRSIGQKLRREREARDRGAQ